MATGIIQLKGRVRTNDPAAVIQWSKLSGAGSVSYAPSANVVSPVATVTLADTYVFRLSVTSRGQTVTDDVTVVVKTNSGPTVSAGPDISGDRSEAITLAGSAIDDGLPAPGILNVTWSKVSGPGTATFANVHAAKTTVSLDKGGTYVLRLTASDGVITNTDDVTVTVATLGTTYAAALPMATPSNLALVDVEFRVDLSLLPAGWWSVVASDGSDIRVSDIGENQLPCDPAIHFNKGAKTGFLVFKGTAGGANTCYKIWCGGTATFLAKDSTYGQYNAYQNAAIGFWPDGSGVDRTRNKNDMQPTGVTSVAGTIGVSASRFGTGNSSYCGIPNGFTGPYTLSVVSSQNLTGEIAFLNAASSATGSYGFVGTTGSTGYQCRSLLGGNIGTNWCETPANDTTWAAYNARFPSGGTHDAVTLIGTIGQTSLITVGAINFLSLGASGDGTTSYPGIQPVCLAECVNDNLPVEYLRYWELMLDQSTFWNCTTWSLNSEPTTQFAALVFPTDWSHYAQATPDNPGSTLTQTQMVLDMSVLPNSWWTNATITGNDIRISTDTNSPQAFDLIHYDPVAKTGILVFITTKTTSNQTYRVWQRTGGAAKPDAADPTFGRYGAYPLSVVGFYPDGSGNDRTVYRRHLGMTNSPPVAGNLGPMTSTFATTYNGVNQYGLALANTPGVARPSSMMGWALPVSSAGTQAIASNFSNGLVLEFDTSLHAVAYDVGITAATTVTATLNQWSHVAAQYVSAVSRTVYIAGGNAVGSAGSAGGIAAGLISIGSNGAGASFFNGRLSMVFVYSVAVSADWINYNWTMANPAAFWNTWTYV